MQRDLDLCREVLLTIESGRESDVFAAGDNTNEVLREHGRLLVESGFVELRICANPFLSEVRITWAGHEFLDRVRNEAVWIEAHRVLRDRMLFVPVDVLCQLIDKLLRDELAEASP